jgi:hypothetical protein
MNITQKQIVRLAVLAAVGLSLMGCNTIRNAAGLGKEAPDEFAVVTKAPLVIPPDFNLRPPRDGAPPVNQLGPTDTAQAALFDTTDPAAVAKAIPGDYSESEKQLLVTANAVNPDPSIRQQIASDGRAMEAANDTFTKQVLFWQDAPPAGVNVDADTEARRLDAQKNGGATQAITPKRKATDSATIQDEKKKEDSGGWFDWF